MGAFALLVTVASAASFSLASADTTAVPAVGAMTPQGRGGMMGAHKPGVMGTVTAISGNTITVTSKQFSAHQWGGSGTAQASPTTQPTPTTITYTVDATNATVKKNAATSAVSSIAVGDMVMVQGTVSGTSVTATSIIDGMGRGMGNGTESDGGGANIAKVSLSSAAQSLQSRETLLLLRTPPESRIPSMPRAQNSAKQVRRPQPSLTSS